MSYDASVGALRCPFCGSENLKEQADGKETRPSGVVPFVVSQEQAVTAMRAWLSQGFWRPGDLAAAALVVKMTPVYVPYWVFEARTFTYWTADTNQMPQYSSGDWFPMFGRHEGSYSDVLVGASSALNVPETTALLPFDLSTAAPPEQVDLTNITYERFSVQRKFARPQARSGLESLELAAIAPQITGNHRNLKVNTRIIDLHSRPLLLPVWVMAYRYQDQVYRFVANGQTGRSTGRAPVSYRKIAAAVGLAVLALVMLLVVLSAFGK